MYHLYSNLKAMEAFLRSRGLVYTLGSAAILYIMKRYYSTSATVGYATDSAVFITGCDTGLGYSMAVYCKETLKLSVIASCVNQNSVGAQNLDKLGITVVELDLGNDTSITNCAKFVEEYIRNNELKLKVIINNAALMTFGEFDWKPVDSVVKEVNVNLLGPIKLTKFLMNLILSHHTRIVNICSHCSLETLPGLVPYGLSKAGMLAWTNGLRTELDKYGVKVVAVIPGTFYTQSSIMSDPEYYISQMKKDMSLRAAPIQALYGEYFHNYLNYVSSISKYSVSLDKPACIEDDLVMRNIHHALVDSNPRALYQCNNVFRYKFYHFIFRLLPCSYFKDRLIIYFMQMPVYRNDEKNHNEN
uniref:D-beta-hydroxybutyrate dehydrogenase, mitochondrial n=1 Tax=Cacopsylla melanoneura TaxID=428564 RepID=A0A8D8US84_9HEMI